MAKVSLLASWVKLGLAASVSDSASSQQPGHSWPLAAALAGGLPHTQHRHCHIHSSGTETRTVQELNALVCHQTRAVQELTALVWCRDESSEHALPSLIPDWGAL